MDHEEKKQPILSWSSMMLGRARWKPDSIDRSNNTNNKSWVVQRIKRSKLARVNLRRNYLAAV